MNTYVHFKENLTIVTAYWDIGSFKKGTNAKFTPKHYEDWAQVFEFILNPLVVYTNSKTFANLMRNFRLNLKHKTKIIVVKQSEFWPFRMLQQIQSVFDQPGYPVHYPNTFIAEYSAIQHAKFAVAANATMLNVFPNKFYGWVDIGYFRDIVKEKKYFRLNAPSDKDETRLSVNEVYNPFPDISPEKIFKENVVWVGGGMFIGTKEVILKFEKLYQRAIYHFLEKKVMNSDQQVIYSIYSKEGQKLLKPEIKLQLYKPHDMQKVHTKNPWFYLGYLCREVISQTAL